MANYLFTSMETGEVLGQRLGERTMRPFVSIAEAYETLARMEAEIDDIKTPGETFNAWRLCEITPVESR